MVVDARMSAAMTLRDRALPAFIFAGNATFTVVSKRTSARHTFRVRCAREGNPRFYASVLTGSDNEKDYTFVGTCWADGRMKAAPSAPEKPAAALAWLLRNLGALALDQAEVYHEGRCGRCGRLLTVPESIRSGLGPKCAQRVGPG